MKLILKSGKPKGQWASMCGPRTLTLGSVPWWNCEWMKHVPTKLLTIVAATRFGHLAPHISSRGTCPHDFPITSNSMGVVLFAFHVLQLLTNRHQLTQHNKNLKCISKFTMKHRHKLDWRPDISLFSKCYWKVHVRWLLTKYVGLFKCVLLLSVE
jgi:hypothetical protein